MKIGIDLDDTTFVTVDAMVKYADMYDINVLGKTGSNNKMGLIKDRYYLEALYGWSQKEKYDFFDTYYKNVLEECTPMEGVAEVIQKLKNEGNEIYFITARLTNILNCDTEAITIKSLKDNNIPYDKLIINISKKLEACKKYNIDLFIEDSYQTCKELEEYGIKSYLKTTIMNKEIDADNIERFDTWKELYEKIENKVKIGMW